MMCHFMEILKIEFTIAQIAAPKELVPKKLSSIAEKFTILCHFYVDIGSFHKFNFLKQIFTFEGEKNVKKAPQVLIQLRDFF